MPVDPERTLSGVRVDVARILGNSLEGRDLAVPDLVRLLECRGPEFLALLQAADSLRRRSVGDRVTYVVNRNINFTNVCAKKCSFCAFSRTYRSDEGYLLPVSEIVRRAREARKFGATEVCIQAGLPPAMPGDLYIRICQAVTDALPGLHVHAFSPEEISYGCQRSGMPVRDYLVELRDAGIGSLPGTSAEILDDDLRDLISPGRISSEEWTRVISTAHSLGIRTSSTMMFGHLETPVHIARHLAHLRTIQRQTGGFTEFVPLGFVHTEAPLYQSRRLPNLRPGPTGWEVLKVHAVARMALDKDIPNLQVSWVKEGMKLAQLCLAAGGNDLGGTLINESISTAAGAGHGQLVTPEELHRVIRDAGRVPAERNTLYGTLRTFTGDDEDGPHPLDSLRDGDRNRFGSYARLTRSRKFRFSRGAAPGGRTRGTFTAEN